MSKFKGKKVVVVGLGKSGASAVRYLVEQGAKVTVSDIKTKNELVFDLNPLADLKFEQDFGKHTPKVLSTADYIVMSPGVKLEADVLQEVQAAKVPIINDIELVYPHIQCPIIAVTGTNGKTTTATLIAEMLRADGKQVFLGGNIGTPALQYLKEERKIDVVVLELSSFQLESVSTFKPDVAVVTNIEPNHLDRYPTGMEGYFQAKKRILAATDKTSLLVANMDNGYTSRLVEGFTGRTLYFSKRNPLQVNGQLSETFKGAYLSKPKLILKLPNKTSQDVQLELMYCKLPGDHNKENIMAATLASQAVGCSFKAIQNTIDNFKGVSHRLEFVRKKDGVYFYNDSKSTSVPSLMRALNSFIAPITLIAGGRDKDQDFSPVGDSIRKKVKNLILLGESKEKMNRAIGDFSETFLVGTFEEAILLAYQKSRNGDVILLSPACASYDMFKNYEERGDYFKKLVEQL